MKSLIFRCLFELDSLNILIKELNLLTSDRVSVLSGDTNLLPQINTLRLILIINCLAYGSGYLLANCLLVINTFLLI